MRLTKALIVAASSVFSTLAVAGYTSLAPMTVNTVDGYAFGSMSGTRYSSNSVEYIFCQEASSGQVACSVRDASGVGATCSTDRSIDPSFAEVARAINAASFVSLRWDPETGRCTSILVRNGSTDLH